MPMVAGLTDTRGSGGATAHEVAPGSWSDVSLAAALLRLVKSQRLLQSLNDRGPQFFRAFDLGSP